MFLCSSQSVVYSTPFKMAPCHCQGDFKTFTARATPVTPCYVALPRVMHCNTNALPEAVFHLQRLWTQLWWSALQFCTQPFPAIPKSSSPRQMAVFGLTRMVRKQCKAWECRDEDRSRTRWDCYTVRSLPVQSTDDSGSTGQTYNTKWILVSKCRQVWRSTIKSLECNR